MTGPETNDGSLTGVWNGLYSYASGHPESCFTAVLLDSGGFLSGTIHETMKRRSLPDVETNAAIDGRVDGSDVRFVKSYDGSGGQTHSVSYDGRLNGDGSEIEGVWTIRLTTATTRGRFLMIRSLRAIKAETARRVVTASGKA